MDGKENQRKMERKREWELSAERADTFEAKLSDYSEKWALLNSKDELFPLEFRHIPWPVPHFVERLEDITQADVERFVFSSSGDRRKPAAMAALRVWHLDKLARVLSRVVPSQRDTVAEAAHLICTALTNNL